MVRHCGLRSGSANGREGKRSPVTALGRRDPGAWLSKEAQREPGSLRGRAVRVGNSGKESPKSSKAR